LNESFFIQADRLGISSRFSVYIINTAKPCCISSHRRCVSKNCRLDEYANFGSLITAILTCVLLVLVVVYLFKSYKGLNIAIMNVSGFATATSLLPLMLGFSYITVIGVIVSVLLAAIFGVCFIKIR